SQECITAFNDLKLAKKYKYVIFKLSDDNREIVVEDAAGGRRKDWDEGFAAKLMNAKTKTVRADGTEPADCRYAVYDLQYDLASGEGVRNKIAFITWSPDTASVRTKMTYSSSKTALERALTGIAENHHASDSSEIEFAYVVNKVSRNKGLVV
ncbi:cofilin/tropomyosin-type actin-binding protein, partial [Pseudomassariella vexata]